MILSGATRDFRFASGYQIVIKYPFNAHLLPTNTFLPSFVSNEAHSSMDFLRNGSTTAVAPAVVSTGSDDLPRGKANLMRWEFWNGINSWAVAVTILTFLITYDQGTLLLTPKEISKR